MMMSDLNHKGDNLDILDFQSELMLGGEVRICFKDGSTCLAENVDDLIATVDYAERFEIVDEKDEVVDMQELAKEQWQQVQNRQMARAKRLNAKKPESKLKSERKD